LQYPRVIAPGARQELEKRYPDGLPRLDPLEDLGVDEPGALAAVRAMEALEVQLAANAAFQARPAARAVPTG
jgi:ATP-dependent RNA helicase DOB1